MIKNNETQKAGCYLVDVKNKKVALVYREKRNDWSFPKGHREEGETIQECAVRETAEETKRIAEIVPDIDPVVERYVTPSGEHCVCCMFVAIDKGHSDNASWDTHDTYFIDIDKVEEKLSYDDLKQTWREIRKQIEKLF